MPRHVLASHPPERPTGPPGTRIGARVVHGQIVLERVEIRTRDSFDQLQLIGVRQSAVSEPEVLVKPARINNKRPGVPLRDGPAIVQRVLVIAADLALMASAVGV